jgi:hypothetical protein
VRLTLLRIFPTLVGVACGVVKLVLFLFSGVVGGVASCFEMGGEEGDKLTGGGEGGEGGESTEVLHGLSQQVQSWIVRGCAFSFIAKIILAGSFIAKIILAGSSISKIILAVFDIQHIARIGAVRNSYS